MIAVVAALLAAPALGLPPEGGALLDRCAAVERVAAAGGISGEYLVSDLGDDCGGRVGSLASRRGDAAGPGRDLARFDRALLADPSPMPASRAETVRGDAPPGEAALGVSTYTIPLKGCARPQRLVDRRGAISGVEVRNILAPDRGLALIILTNRPLAAGEPGQDKGALNDLLSAALCPESLR